MGSRQRTQREYFQLAAARELKIAHLMWIDHFLTTAMQQSLADISETLIDDEDAVVAKLEDLLGMQEEDNG
jgi:hypothetical protein